jgi:predicted Fe-Mo cluster-binding NifX family protein
MSTKIAVPAEGNKLCSHFGHCQSFYIAEVEDGKIVNETTVTPPAHEPGVFPKWVSEQGINTVIAGGMGEKAKDMLSTYKIDVHLGVPTKATRELVEDYLNDTLVTGKNNCDHKH